MAQETVDKTPSGCRNCVVTVPLQKELMGLVVINSRVVRSLRRSSRLIVDLLTPRIGAISV